MSESRTKLNFRPGVIIGEKSPPPTGLLINHGKPNFTISRTVKKTNAIPSKDSQSENFVTMNRRALLKKTPSNEIFKKDEDKDCVEFLQAHKKISEKIAKENIENCRAEREEVNNNTSVAISQSVKEEHFVKIQNGKLNNAAVVTNNIENKEDVTLKVNGCSKPAVPEKPAILQNYKPTSPTGLSINTNIPPFKKYSGPTSPASPIQNGVNFEQKTFVSFSKDLSSEPNKYPECVKFTKPVEHQTDEKDRVLEELTKLKFEIVSNGESVVPVVRNH